MDHGGRFERDGRTMSQVSLDGFDLCDNVVNSETLTAQTQNLNETQSLPLTQNDEEETSGLSQKASLNNNGKDEQEEVKRKEEYTGRRRDEDEEEDTDEVMKEEEEEEESEASSSLMCCQSPDIPMTDSSYSETGSLLETPYPLSPGTSPEPISPIGPVVSSETLRPIDLLEISQSDAELTGPMSCAHGPTSSSGPADFPPRVPTPDGPSGPTCVTGASDKMVEDVSAEQVTSSAEPVINRGSASSDAGPVNSATRTDASTPASATTKPGPDATESTSTASHLSSSQEQSTFVPVTTCSLLSTCSKGSVLSPALLESLEQLAQRDDDTHLPQYFHQIAEACVLQKDYQRAVWFIQLERLYHQRVLDNLNALQKQWESHCEGTASDLATQHLEALKHVCRTHTRPRTRDAECAVLDVLRPKPEGGGLQPSCTSTHQLEAGMEQRAEDSSSSLRHSRNLLEKLSSPENDREDPSEELEGRDIFDGSKLMEKQAHGLEVRGGVECTISVMGNGMRPSSARDMDRSNSAEQQGEDLGPAQEREAKGEEVESDIEEATEALAMEDEEEEERKEEAPHSCQKALSVETLVSGAELEEQELQTEDLIQEKLQDESQQCPNTQQQSSTTWRREETLPPDEALRRQQEQRAEKKEEEEEEEEDYEGDQADLVREAPALDHMAKLITVEEMSPASGLVSILKKRSVYGNVVSSVPKPEKPTAKRRVRFRVPDDSYDHEVGSGDSCVLLFLLCLVTVVISIGGTALYCAFADAQSSVCQDFSRNADFYVDQIHRGISQLQLWFAPGS